MHLLSVDEVIDQLSDAQCLSGEAVKRLLRDLTPRLQRAHSGITEAALYLLEAHPHSVIPFISDLISDDTEDTTKLLEVYSRLLQSDRTLMIPIIGSLSEVNLSWRHMLDMRKTMVFALSVVDETDLPVIIHTLLKQASTDTQWICDQIRKQLKALHAPDILALILIILKSYVTMNRQVGHCLKSLPQSKLTIAPFDLMIWIVSLSHYAQNGTDIQTCVDQCVAKGCLLSPISTWKLKQSFQVLSEFLKQQEYSNPIQQFITLLESSCPLTLQSLVACVRLIHLFFNHSSLHLSSSFMSELSSNFHFHAHYSSSQVASLVGRAIFSGDDESKWSKELISIRKQLMFGQRPHRQSENDVHEEEENEFIRHLIKIFTGSSSKRPPPSIVSEIITLLHENIPFSPLSNRLTIDFFYILNEILIHYSPINTAHIYEERVVKHPVLSACVDQFDDNEVKSVGIHRAKRIQIDLGLLWNKPFTSSSHVISFVVQHLATSTFNALNISLLIPTVCIPLYEVVDSDDHDDGTTMEDIQNMSLNQLLKAVCAFALGASVTLTALNSMARKSLAQCKRTLLRRSSAPASIPTDDDQSESSDHRVTWLLLERLTELYRMLKALVLAFNIVSVKCPTACHYVDVESVSSDLDIHVDKKGVKQLQRLNNDEKSTLSRINSIMTNVKNTLFSTSPSTVKESSYVNHSYQIPSARLDTLVFGLIAVPDEVEMSNSDGAEHEEGERDIQLVQMDKFLLRLILRTLRRATCTSMQTNNQTRRRRRQCLVQSNTDELDGVEVMNDFENCENEQCVTEFIKKFTSSEPTKRLNDLSHDDVKTALEEIYKKLNDENENIFLDDVSDEEEDENEDEEKNKNSIHWAVGSCYNDQPHIEYIKDCIDSVIHQRQQQDDGVQYMQNMHLADILHSPEFAALLLDRAVSYARLARNLCREGGHTGDDMSDVLSVCGMSLSCLLIILREIPTFHDEATNENDDIWETIRIFIERMNECLLVSVPYDEHSKLEDEEDEKRYGKVFQCLQWVNITSPDSLLSNLSCEILITLAELDVLPITQCRRLLLASYVTVYEIDNHSITDLGDLKMIRGSGLNAWLALHRGVGSTDQWFRSFNIDDDDDDEVNAADLPPWIIFVQDTNQYEYYRLSMYFNGMNVMSGLVEGIAWVEELSSMKHLKKCDILIDMFGLQTIINLFLDIVKQTTQLGVPATTSIDRIELLLRPLFLSGTLFVNSLRLYNGNTEKQLIVSSLQNEKKKNKSDDVFQYEVMTKSISIVQQLTRRIDEVNQWYSNEFIQVPQIPEVSIELLHQLIALVTKSLLTQSYQFIKSIRAIISSTPVQSRGRKAPAFQHAHADSNVNNESKACKLIPRLSNVCQQLDKAVNRLCVSMGLLQKLPTLHSSPHLFLPAKLQFGVGLNYNYNDSDILAGGFESDEDEADQEELNTNRDLGFHAIHHQNNPEREHDVEDHPSSPPTTISVRFRRR